MFTRGIEPKAAMKTGAYNDLTTSDLYKTSMLVEKYSEEELKKIYDLIRARNILLDNKDINALSRHEQIFFNNQIVKAIKLSRKTKTQNDTSHFKEGCAVKFDFCGKEQKVYIEFVGKRNKKVKLGIQGRMFGYVYVKNGEEINKNTWKLSSKTQTLLSKEEQEAFDKEQNALIKEKEICDLKIAIKRTEQCVEKYPGTCYEKDLETLKNKLNQLLNPKKEEVMKTKSTKKQTVVAKATKKGKKTSSDAKMNPKATSIKASNAKKTSHNLKNDRFNKTANKCYPMVKDILINQFKLKPTGVVRDNPKVYSEFFIDKHKNLYRLCKFSTNATCKSHISLIPACEMIGTGIAKRDLPDTAIKLLKNVKKEVKEALSKYKV